MADRRFASTLLLSFLCAPLLKQHILHTLSMTNEELASLEPIIAQAWDQWDHQVRPPPRCMTRQILTFPPGLCSVDYTMLNKHKSLGRGKPPDGQPLGEVAPPPPPHTYTAAVELGDAQTTAQPFFPPHRLSVSRHRSSSFARYQHRSTVAVQGDQDGPDPSQARRRHRGADAATTPPTKETPLMPAARHTRRFTSSPLPLARSHMPSPPAVEEAPSWLSQCAGTSNAQADHTLHLRQQCYAAFRRGHHSMQQSQWCAGDCRSRGSSYVLHHHKARRQNGARTCARLASLHYWLVNTHATQSRLLATRTSMR
ncbi:hypothetical protein F5148DRAFT_1232320 [Russula earlei]|uniref:Uncharacterized protein n=1 Tax=Russula earlei TaxID=71964 RepID=A0ACC0TZ12_9AGAM|nr:hypothetical protein F5148DRAFT_1232320 [Russula earlei]